METKSIHKAIVIGTSAGGIEALDYLLPHIPPNKEFAFFIVQHISPSSDSYFIRIYKEKCKVTLREVCHTDEIVPGSVYFAPPDYHLLIEKDYTLTISSDEKVNFSRPSIDVLFESAADVYRDRLTGILLTGANHDGSKGLKYIQKMGGNTIIQEPSNATYSEMPKSALKIMKPDKILTLQEIGQYLENLPLLKLNKL